LKFTMRRARYNVGRSEEGVAIGWALGHGFGTEHSSCAWLVLYDNLLAQGARQVFTNQAGHEIQSTSRGEVHNDAHWPRRVRLRPGKARDGRKRGSTRCQMQNISAGKFHGGSSPVTTLIIRPDVRLLDDWPPLGDYGVLQ
jgi:hypothetical protein